MSRYADALIPIKTVFQNWVCIATINESINYNYMMGVKWNTS